MHYLVACFFLFLEQFLLTYQYLTWSHLPPSSDKGSRFRLRFPDLKMPQNRGWSSHPGPEVEGRTQVEPRLPSLLQKAMARGLHKKSFFGRRDLFFFWKTMKKTPFFIGKRVEGGMDKTSQRWVLCRFGFLGGFHGIVQLLT